MLHVLHLFCYPCSSVEDLIQDKSGETNYLPNSKHTIRRDAELLRYKAPRVFGSNPTLSKGQRHDGDGVGS